MIRSLRLVQSAAPLFAAALIASALPAAAAGPADETRELVATDARTRSLVLTEMRDLLFAVNQVMRGAADNDMAAVAKAARFVGLSHFATAGDKGALPVYKTETAPMEFRRLGAQVHASFDRIADAAERGGEPMEIVRQLADTTNNCIACHAKYRFPALEPERRTTMPPSVMNPR
ncbi:MAG: hypothetical protein AB7P21_13610 [Lautropia sp.]